jgi:Cu/Ag efflux pump CusA
LARTANPVDRRTVGSSTSNSNEDVEMSKQHPVHGFSFAILFLLLLLAIAAGPIGFAVLVMAGIPIAILVGIESMAHSGSKLR